MNPALFLDRDGVIIENNPNYIRSWSDVKIFPEAIRALRRIQNSSYKIAIITNQSAVGRGLVSFETICEINTRLIDEIQSHGGRIDGVFICPHAPEDGCTCRKPKPGLILQAAQDLSIDLKQSILIGDALSDLIAGQVAGIPTNVLILTGRGKEQATMLTADQKKSILIFESLAEALEALV
ncbi:MAG: HAD family hydrolase [Anaerolineales bacterium]|nr:HAD family hydrolase [Anaerolineales bacterium]